MRKRVLIGVACAIFLAAACSEDDSAGPGGSDAGTDSSAGSGGDSGASGGGSSSGGSSTGGSSSGGSPAGGSGGTIDASAGSAGMSSGGSAGTGGSGGSGGSAGSGGTMDAGMCDPPPDAGCSDAGVSSPQEAYLKTDLSQGSLEFGEAVAMDGNTLVATTIYYPLTGGNYGAALVFTRDCNGWSLQDVLVPDNPAPDDKFGSSVAIDGDTIVVGAEDESGPADGVSRSGAAYVFTRCGSDWTQEGYLRAPNADRDDRFGTSVDVDGDVIVVGAPQEDSNATGIDNDQTNNDAKQAGAVYVFRRGSGGWAFESYLKASNAGQFDNFGDTVGISGDTIVASATGEDSSSTGINGGQGDDGSYIDSGAVYVFVHGGSGWSQQAYIKASNTGGNLNLGESLAIDGDTFVAGSIDETGGDTGVNGDQTTTIYSSGAAYVFVRSGVTWSQQAYLKASNTGPNDRFGTSVAISGDQVLVGAPQEDSAAMGLDGDGMSDAADGAGAAYLYTRTSGSWAFSHYVKASNTAVADLFGTTLAISNGAFVVNAPFEDSGATGTNGDQSDNSKGNSGALYVFRP